MSLRTEWEIRSKLEWVTVQQPANESQKIFREAAISILAWVLQCPIPVQEPDKPPDTPLLNAGEHSE